MNLLTSSVLALALAPAAAARQEAGPTSAPIAASVLAFDESAAVDLYFHVRALAQASGAPPPELAKAVDEVRAIDRELGGLPLAWGPIEGMLAGCKTAADVARAFERLPEMLELRGGKSVHLRDGAVKLANALIAVEPAFLAGAWKEHEGAIAAARARLQEGFVPKERACLEFHLKSLGMDDPRLAIPVYLTADGPWPGAVTHRGEDGRGVCFVAVNGVEGSQLFETVLHEATHALDVATPGRSALESLRERLEAAGLGPRDAAARDLPHALMFVQSAESIRRTVDPAHVDYGVRQKVYEKMGAMAELVRGYWADFLDGRLSRDEALDGIVAGVKK